MRCHLVVGLVLLAAVPAAAQDRMSLYSTPNPPPRDVLDRLSLQMAWQNSVPMDGRRDGFLALYAAGPHLIAQTRSGLVCLLNAEDGRILWQTRLGKAYSGTLPPGFNSFIVVVINNGIIYGLERDTGRISWEYPLPFAMSVAPVCDEDNLYLSTGTQRVFAFRLPRGELDAKPLLPTKPVTGPKPGSSTPGYEELSARLAVVPLWDAPIRFQIELAPVSGGDVVLLAGPNGMIIGLARSGVSNYGTTESFRWNAEGPIVTPPGVFIEIGPDGRKVLSAKAYIGSTDSNLYATDLSRGRVDWRYSAGSPIIRKPVALATRDSAGRTIEDVFVVSERGGMARLDRLTGQALWNLPRGRATNDSNPDLDYFLAANPKFVYCLDRVGRLVIVDRKRGNTLGTLDVRDFVYPVPNEVTDRLYLAANNGLIVCLHDRDYQTPILHRKLVEASALDAAKLADPNLSRQLSRPLEKPLPFPEGIAVPLREVLLELRKPPYDLRISIAERAYREQGKLANLEKPILVPKFDRRSMGEVLQDILDQAESTYIVLDAVLILPGKGAQRPKPPEKP
jgi:outer membrane protein assembly factor BamB